MPKYVSWSSKNTAAQKLLKLFDLYRKTNGEAGVDYKLNSAKEIEDQVYNKHDFLQRFNPDYFSKTHFRNLRTTWLTAEAKENGRKKKINETTG